MRQCRPRGRSCPRPGGGGAARPPREPYHLVPGSFRPSREPDGNSIFLDAPEGLILVDTGRHPEHQERLIAYARERAAGRSPPSSTPTGISITAAAMPRSAPPIRAPQLYASNARSTARSKGFLPPQPRAQPSAISPSGQASPAQAADVRLDLAAMDAPRHAPARPADHPLGAQIGSPGGGSQVNLAPLCRDRGRRLDLRSGDPRPSSPATSWSPAVPFLDTACPEGWRKALAQHRRDSVRRPWCPGHGDPMTHAQFEIWRQRLWRSCSIAPASSRSRDECVAAGGRHDAAAFIPARHGCGRDGGLLYRHTG